MSANNVAQNGAGPIPASSITVYPLSGPIAYALSKVWAGNSTHIAINHTQSEID